MADATKDHSRVTPEGKACGEQMVRLTEPTIKLLEEKGVPDERCKTCAFRPGTVPNGCLQTQADALKSVMEGNMFLCHQDLKNPKPCYGYLAARGSVLRANNGEDVRVKMPYDYSPDDIEHK